MKKKFIILFGLLGAFGMVPFLHAADIINNDYEITGIGCAESVFETALLTSSNIVSESNTPTEIEAWIYKVMGDKTTIQSVLDCPELKNLNDDETITFPPINFTFSGGREIVINYETQPKILKQKLIASNKRGLPDSNPNPKIGDDTNGTIWTNTDPAWYAIMVVQHGALDNFVGENKNNTISLDYIKQNIDNLYPNGSKCTSKTALANDKEIVNLAAKNTVSMKDDSNDYYVAGDADLSWIGWAEVGLDVAITVATVGGGTVVLGAVKGARATRVAKDLAASIKTLEKADKVKDYLEATRALNRAKDVTEVAKTTDNVLDIFKDTDKIIDMINKAPVRGDKQLAEYLKISESDIKTIKKYINPETGKLYSGKSQKGKEFLELVKKSDKEKDIITETKTSGKSVEQLEKEIKELEKSDDVKKYKETTQSFEKVMQLRRDMKAWKIPQRGNVIARAWKSMRAINTGTKTLNKGAKLGRAATRSGRVKDWLFHSTMKNVGKLAKMERQGGMLYGTMKFVGKMYDFTETSTGEFTNDVQFEPLLLLSADDLNGQDNVVNYGMWLMWAGDSTSAVDDDAAYLQAMDFAAKFHQDLTETQEDNSGNCAVDIYVVRPILRNPGDADSGLYYLIMNDVPWTVD